MMKINKKVLLAVLFMLLFSASVSAQFVGHSASQILAGTFPSGSYVFPNDLEVNGNVSVAGSVDISGDLNLSSNNEFNIGNNSLKDLDKNAEIDGSVLGIMMTNPPNQELPHFILQSGGSSQASVILRSLMIANEINDFHNTTDRTDCPAYMSEIGEELKIDCNTTTTGADLLVSDDLQVVGDTWIKDADGEWKFMTKVLRDIDNIQNNMVSSDLNFNLYANGGNVYFNITEINDDNIAVTINHTEYFISSSSQVQLSTGTYTAPVQNYIYYEMSGGVPVLSKGTSLPIGDFAYLGCAKIGNASGSSFENYGSCTNSATTDAIIQGTQFRFYYSGVLYIDGFDPIVSSDSFYVGNGSALFVTTVNNLGVEKNTSVDGFYFINSTGDFVNANSLDVFDNYYDGTSIGVNKFFPVVWGVMKQDGNSRLVAVLPNAPSTEYSSANAADVDNEQIANYFPPDSSLKRLFLPIGKTVIKKVVGTDTNQVLLNGLYYRDIRGFTGASVGGSSGGITSHAQLSELDYASSGHTGFVSDSGDTINGNVTIINGVAGQQLKLSWAGSNYTDVYSDVNGDLVINPDGNILYFGPKSNDTRDIIFRRGDGPGNLVEYIIRSAADVLLFEKPRGDGSNLISYRFGNVGGNASTNAFWQGYQMLSPAVNISGGITYPVLAQGWTWTNDVDPTDLVFKFQLGNTRGANASFGFEPFGSGGNVYFLPDSGGAVGFGTTGPAVLVEVEDTTIDGDIFRLQDSDGTCDANPEAGGVTWTCASDEEIKTNIVNKTDSVLDKLDQLRITEYNVKVKKKYIKDYKPKKIIDGKEVGGEPIYDVMEYWGNETKTGVIAQEYAEIFPDRVQEKDGILMVKSINDWEFVKAFQELKEENDLIKSELCSKDGTYSWC